MLQEQVEELYKMMNSSLYTVKQRVQQDTQTIKQLNNQTI